MSNITQTLNTVIHNRRSHSKLVAPAPSHAELEEAVNNAITAPDHRQLQPWHFYSVTETGLDQLSTLFSRAYQDMGIIEPDRLEKVAKHPYRAPMIIVCIAKIVEHPKVPEFEQILATGSAIQNLLLSFEAMGYGTMWRTGDLVHSVLLKSAFNAQAHDYLAGFIYVGTKDRKHKARPPKALSECLHAWTEPMS